MPRDFQIVGSVMAKNGADGGMDQSWIRPPTGFHIVRCAFMITFAGNHGSHQGCLMHQLRGFRQGMRELDVRKRCGNGFDLAADFGASMRVERLQLARPTLHP